MCRGAWVGVSFILVIRPASTPDSSPNLPVRPNPGDRAPALAICLVYAGVFAVFGLHGPYLPVWLSARGLSESQISWVMGAPLVLRLLFTPLIGHFADSRADRRPLLLSLVAASMLAVLAMSRLSGFWPLLLATCIMLISFQPIQPVIDATVGSLIRRKLVGDIGRLRLWGSVSFAVVAVAAGFVLERWGIETVFSGYFLLLSGAFLAILLLPSAGGERVRVITGPFALWRRPALLVVLVSVALINASQAMFFGFGSVHMIRLGYPQWSIGILWTLAVVAEIVVLWFAPGMLARLGAHRLLLISAACTLLRWLGMAFDPPMAGTGLLQLLHAGTLSCTYLGLMAFIQRLVEDDAAARAQSAAVTMTGLMMAVMMVVTGPVYQAFGGQAYLVAAVLPALAFGLLIIARRRLA